MAKCKTHLKGVKGRRFTDEIRKLDKERILVVPIDGAKNSHKCLVANYLGDILAQPFEFSNCASGVKLFDTTVRQIARQVNAQKIIIGLEPTGHYYENLYFSLSGLGYDVIQTNPYSTKLQRSIGLNWCKTDERDLCAIGQVLISNEGTETQLHSGLWYNLKQLARLHRAEVRRETAIKSQIRTCMDRIFPGFQSKEIFSNFWCNASILLMENYPRPTQIKKLGEKRLRNFLYKRNIRLCKLSLHSLFSAAGDAISLSEEDLEVHLLNLQLKLQDLRRSNEKIRLLGVKLAEFLVHTPAIVLISIPYVNVPSASEFAAEMGPFSDFRHARQVIKKTGTNPGRYQTGKYDSPDTPITRQGMSSLRNIVSLISNNLAHNKYFAKWCDEFITEGKDKSLAKTVLGNKFIRISFAMMRDHKLFEPRDWKGESLADDPIEKLKKFLSENRAEHLIESLCEIAKTQIKQG